MAQLLRHRQTKGPGTDKLRLWWKEPVLYSTSCSGKMKNKKREFETIFKSSHDWQCNACLNWSNDPLEIYTIGYKEAADNLVRKVFDERHKQDALVYPICFLYRQYIELRLKENNPLWENPP